MVTTIIILATLLALALGFVVGGGLGMHFATEKTTTTIESFASFLTTDILEAVEEQRNKQREEDHKKMEEAKASAMEALDRLERLKMMSNDIFTTRPGPMTAGSFMESLMRMANKREVPEGPKSAVETMGDHFDELFNQKPEDIPTEPKEEE